MLTLHPSSQASHCSGRVWPAAIVLGRYLESERCERLRARDAAILELGAGTGWLALKMSSRFASWTATETTEGGALDRLERNLAKFAGGGTRGSPIARALDWNDAEGFVDSVGRGGWDLVCGSDLVYSEAGASALARCLDALLGDGDDESAPTQDGDGDGDGKSAPGDERRRRRRPMIAIAQTCGRWGGHGYDEALYRALANNSLRAEAVFGETLPDDDTTLAQHVVVFSITRSPGGSSGIECVDIERDRRSHPLLRAARIREWNEAAQAAALTEDDRRELDATRLFDELSST